MSLRNRWFKLMIAAAIVLPGVVAGAHPTLGATRAHLNAGFNKPGDLLITDQFNNRVIEVNSSKQIVWQYGSGNPTPAGTCESLTPGHVTAPNDAERLGDGYTLITGTGTPAGTGQPACPDNRVFIVSPQRTIVWQYGTGGSTTGPLNTPVFAIELPDHDVMITDQGNNRIIVVDIRTRAIEWTYPTSSTPNAYLLNNPNSAELLPNGHVLIADENNSRALEVDSNGAFVWSAGPDVVDMNGSPDPLNIVAFASRLPNPNGNTLITDSGNNRIVEINAAKKIVWQYSTAGACPSVTPNPSNAVRLADDDTVIADQFNNRVLIVDPNKSTEFQYGGCTAGNGFNQLNAPYTAFVIGDYTGQTPPPEDP